MRSGGNAATSVLAVAPEDAPDSLPTEFGAVATVAIGVVTTSTQEAQLGSLLCAAVDVTHEEGDDASRTVLVTTRARPGWRRLAPRPGRPVDHFFCFAPKSPCWSAVSPG